MLFSTKFSTFSLDKMVSNSSFSSFESLFFIFSKQCVEIKYIRELANNIKHFYYQAGNEVQETLRDGLKWEDEFSWEEEIHWDYDGFMIAIKGNRRVPALIVFQKVQGYWVNCFNTVFKDCT